MKDVIYGVLHLETHGTLPLGEAGVECVPCCTMKLRGRQGLGSRGNR